MENQVNRRVAAMLARSVEKGANAIQLADAIISAWQAIDAALGPIIGQKGVAALYKRSVYLTIAAHAWLGSMPDGIQTAEDLAALKSLLVQQSSANVAAAGGALLQTFDELLSSLIGPSLTERLLRSVWANSFSGLPAQDISL